MELREIKFRGLRKAKNMVGVWAVGNYHKGALTGGSFISGYEVIPETVGQYTGKSVSTGEVYEGDIATSIDGTFLVVWDEEKAAFVMQFYTYPNECLYLEEMWGDSRVIGNIHDNPELLEAPHDNA